MKKSGLVTALIILGFFGFYQFRIYRVAAMREETVQAHENFLTWQEQAKAREAEAVTAAAKVPPVIYIPKDGIRFNEAWDGAVNTISTQGSRLRLMRLHGCQ